VACDIGAGPGYFSLRLARAVGDARRVFAVDIEPRILEALRKRIEAAGARNVTPVLSLADDALLPPGACDLILIVDTYHHFPDGPAYLRRLSRSLRPGGRLVNIDFHKRELPVGPALDHKVSRDSFKRWGTDARFSNSSSPTPVSRASRARPLGSQPLRGPGPIGRQALPRTCGVGSSSITPTSPMSIPPIR
jgi:ubiquinone/menaquinone biosynthesis C-methylase UbiE